MDRFIVVAVNYNKFNPENLKSNMDRFIGKVKRDSLAGSIILKSNMDRFIAHSSEQPTETSPAFKIQYG